MGGVVPVVNIEGIKPGDLVLDGPTLADIFLGKITKWDDPAIKKLNPNVNLPSPAIARRASLGRLGHDLHLHQLSLARSAGLEDNVGADTAVEWPVGIGAKGNEGVANNVQQTDGAIGYVEYAYAKQNKLTYTKMVNKDGKAVEPTAEAFAGRRRQCGLERHAGLLRHPDQPAGRDSWPITAATFILMHKQPDDPAAAAEALKFFDWAYAKGGEDGARSSTTCRCPTRSSSDVKEIWAWTSSAPTASRSSPACESTLVSASLAQAPSRSLLACRRSFAAAGARGGSTARAIADSVARCSGHRDLQHARRRASASRRGDCDAAMRRDHRTAETANRRRALGRFASATPLPRRSRWPRCPRAGAAWRRHALADHRRLAGAQHIRLQLPDHRRAGTRSPRNSAPSRRSTARSSPRCIAMLIGIPVSRSASRSSSPSSARYGCGGRSARRSSCSPAFPASSTASGASSCSRRSCRRPCSPPDRRLRADSRASNAVRRPALRHRRADRRA